MPTRVTRLLILGFLASILICDVAKGQAKGGRKWQSPDAQAFFVVPQGFLRQRLKDEDSRVGFWRSRDKKSKLEFFISGSQPAEDLNRPKWENEFLDDAEATFVSRSSYSGAGTKVWVTNAKSKDADSGSHELLQSAMVVADRVYMLRGECTSEKDEQRQIVKRAVLSLGKAVAQADNGEIEGPNGLRGTVWSAVPYEWDKSSTDFSMFIPSGLARKTKLPENVLAHWFSYELGIQVRVAKQPVPQPNEYDSASGFKEGFRRGFMGEMKNPGTEIEFSDSRHQGREIWIAHSETNFLGVTAKTETWVFNIRKKIYVLVVGHDPDNPESIKIAKSIFESVKFRELIHGSETGNVIDEPITFKPEKPKDDLAKQAGRFAGGCIVFLIIVWLWYRLK